MNLLETPRKLAMFVMRLIGLQLLVAYGLCFKFWERTLRPLLQPLIDLALAIKPEDISLMGVLEQSIKLLLTVMLMWLHAVVAVWEVVTWPFQNIIKAIRHFLWDLEYETSQKAKKAKSREEWLVNQLEEEKKKRETAENDGKDGNF